MKWTTQARKINDLIPYAKNPRVITKSELKSLTESLEKFDLAEIPAIDTDNTIIAGHQRLAVMKLLDRGDEVIDVRVPDHKLTEDEFREYNIRSNRNVANWAWDMLEENNTLDELKGWGFTSNELDRYIFDTKEDGFDAEKAYKEIDKPCVVQGEVYKLGRHQLMCGDSTKDVATLMGGNKARLIFTDAPYNVNYKPQKGAVIDSKTHTRGYGDEGIFNDNKSPDDCVAFYTAVLQQLYKNTTDDCAIYWWFAMNNYELNFKAFQAAGWRISQVIMWVKSYMTFSRGVDYHRQYEPCMFGWKDKKTHYRNQKIHDFKDVFNLDYKDFQELFDVWYEKRDSLKDYVHPTQKPVRLAERGIKKSSEMDDIVVDLFGGSGSTLICCDQMSRVCYTMEIDPKFAQTILLRYVKFTGDDPVRLSDGKKWSEIVAQ